MACLAVCSSVNSDIIQFHSVRCFSSTAYSDDISGFHSSKDSLSVFIVKLEAVGCCKHWFPSSIIFNPEDYIVNFAFSGMC